jgi:hypothetical protein
MNFHYFLIDSWYMEIHDNLLNYRCYIFRKILANFSISKLILIIFFRIQIKKNRLFSFIIILIVTLGSIITNSFELVSRNLELTSVLL